jgi:hypothetical protein
VGAEVLLSLYLPAERSISVITILAPRPARRRAYSRPIPLAAPVITATLPDNFFSICFLHPVFLFSNLLWNFNSHQYLSFLLMPSVESVVSMPARLYASWSIEIA